MRPEEWRPIPQFSLQYEASNAGRIKRIETGKILKAAISGSGYKQVCLCKEGVMYPRRVHRLVAEAFIGEITGAKIVEHRDHDKMNCRLENLAISTRSNNIKHDYWVGTRSAKGIKNNQSILTESQVKHIRRLRSRGKNGKRRMLLREVAAKFGVGVTLISKIDRRQLWTHL